MSLTENGMPYTKSGPYVWVGCDEQTTLHLHEISRWKKLGVTSITLPCGVLTAADLLTLAKQP